MQDLTYFKTIRFCFIYTKNYQYIFNNSQQSLPILESTKTSFKDSFSNKTLYKYILKYVVKYNVMSFENSCFIDSGNDRNYKCAKRLFL